MFVVDQIIAKKRKFLTMLLGQSISMTFSWLDGLGKLDLFVSLRNVINNKECNHLLTLDMESVY